MDSFAVTFINKEKLPVLIEPKEKNITLTEFLLFIRENSDFFKQNLLKYGGLLFRGFPIKSEEDFTALIKTLQLGKFVSYVGGDSPRKKVDDKVYTSTEAPPDMKILLHNELSYTNNYPANIYFYCAVPPVENGETILADARQVYQTVDPKVREKFMDKGICYSSCYYHKSPLMQKINKSHKSWVDVFETSDKSEVEQKCREKGMQYEWFPDDWLKISQVRPAAIRHPQTNEWVWFNQVPLFDFNPKFLGWTRYLATKLLYFQKHKRLHEVFYADHKKIPKEDIYHVMDVLDQNTIKFKWQAGDVLVLDNLLAMHGRAPFEGNRRILTSMTG